MASRPRRPSGGAWTDGLARILYNKNAESRNARHACATRPQKPSHQPASAAHVMSSSALAGVEVTATAAATAPSCVPASSWRSRLSQASPRADETVLTLALASTPDEARPLPGVVPSGGQHGDDASRGHAASAAGDETGVGKLAALRGVATRESGVSNVRRRAACERSSSPSRARSCAGRTLTGAPGTLRAGSEIRSGCNMACAGVTAGSRAPPSALLASPLAAGAASEPPSGRVVHAREAADAPAARTQERWLRRLRGDAPPCDPGEAPEAAAWPG